MAFWWSGPAPETCTGRKTPTQWLNWGRDDLPLLPDVDAMLQQGKANTLAFEVKAGDALCFDARHFPQPKFTEQEGGISFKLKWESLELDLII